MNFNKKTLMLPVLVIVFAFTFCGEKPEMESETIQESTQELHAMLPEADDVSGWTMVDEPRFFYPENLWEYINGAADGYLIYGFQEVATADYSQESTDREAIIEIYRMQDALNAFGIYTQERNPESNFSNIGVEGYIGSTQVNFWAGPYYVKITVYEESDDLKKEMLKLAANIAGKIEDTGAEPVQTGYFPQKNQLPHTVKYLPLDVLGQSFLANGFEAHYRVNNTGYKMVLVAADDSDAAKEELALYRQFIATGGKVLKDLSSPGDGGFTGEDSFYGTMMAVRSGNYIVVVLGVPSESTGMEAITELVGNIR